MLRLGGLMKPCFSLAPTRWHSMMYVTDKGLIDINLRAATTMRAHQLCRGPTSRVGVRKAPAARRHIAVHAAAAAPTSIERLRHVTEEGIGLELLLQRSQQASSTKPPLLFVHGSYHSAWCYGEHFLPYFSAQGFDAYAVSLRAQGNSDCVSRDKDGPLLVAGTLDTHAKDLGDLIGNLKSPPVVIAHSFGGLILQKYLQSMASAPGGPGLPYLAGTAFLNCVPPSGNKAMIIRFLLRNPWFSLKLTWGFVARSFATSLESCRELFFSADLPQEDLIRYQKQLAAGSPVRLIDLSDVNKQVPLPPPPPYAPPAFVLGGEDDAVVDVDAIKELAAAYKVTPIVLPKMAHDSMLDTRWEQVASELNKWLATIK